MSEASKNEAIYATGAPEGALWSPWVRPVLFTQLEGLGLSRDTIDLTGLDDARLPDARGCALIVDLPGSESVLLGLAIASRGFRPIPLFNSTSGPAPLVDVLPIAHQLFSGAWLLREIRIPPDTASRSVICRWTLSTDSCACPTSARSLAILLADFTEVAARPRLVAEPSFRPNSAPSSVVPKLSAVVSVC